MQTTKHRRKPAFLHVGCGSASRDRLPAPLRSWHEVRLDIDPSVEPDIIASIVDMSMVETASFDGLWSSHSLEHIDSHDVPTALSESRRVLRDTGFAIFTLPDLQAVARIIADDKLEEPLYQSAAGPISPIDMIYGHRRSVERGKTYMAHRTGFTQRTLGKHLLEAGFEEVDVWSTRYALWAVAIVKKDAAIFVRGKLKPLYEA